MRRLFTIGLLVVLSACGTGGRMEMWRVKDMVLAPRPTIGLRDRNGRVAATVSKRMMQRLLLAHFRVRRAAGAYAELVLIEGDDPNALVGRMSGRTILAVNLAMVRLVGDDIDEFVSLLGHELAHLAKGHLEATRTRHSTLEVVGSLAGMGLGIAGVPAGGSIAGLAVNLIEATFSRDQEREADAAGVGYVMAAGFDPEGAVRLHEKLIRASPTASTPFFSSHPTGEERIRNLRRLIKAHKEP